ncbi:unnamed protein product [Amoebophrya sp. A25]|nr:unnamed protein product [Amoebophrya sp. A25]|eukprot:GSA25T00017132001.1
MMAKPPGKQHLDLLIAGRSRFVHALQSPALQQRPKHHDYHALARTLQSCFCPSSSSLTPSTSAASATAKTSRRHYSISSAHAQAKEDATLAVEDDDGSSMLKDTGALEDDVLDDGGSVFELEMFGDTTSGGSSGALQAAEYGGTDGGSCSYLARGSAGSENLGNRYRNETSALKTKLGRLLSSIPKTVGPARAFDAYRRVEKDETKNMTFAQFEQEYREIMFWVKVERGNRVSANLRKRLKPHLLRNGDRSKHINRTLVYKREDVACGIVTEPEDPDDDKKLAEKKKKRVVDSLVYDRVLATRYQYDFRQAEQSFGSDNFPLGHGSGSMDRVANAALRDAFLEEKRPTLANELSDFKVPYMMQRTSHKRLLEHVARNPIERRAINPVLDSMEGLVKGRLDGDLPPEAVEPLLAFQGIQTGSFCARTRLSQQVASARRAMEAQQRDRSCGRLHDFGAGASSSAGKPLASEGEERESEGGDKSEKESVEDNETWSPLVEDVEDKSKSFTPFTPDPAIPELLGSLKMGKPAAAILEEIRSKRYPTLQCVANRLPKDGTYRSHVWAVINILERQEGWDYREKIRAVQTLKEVYANLDPSTEWRRKLDKKMPLNTPSKRERRKRKHGHRSQYVQQVSCGKRRTKYSKNRRRIPRNVGLVKRSTVVEIE